MRRLLAAVFLLCLPALGQNLKQYAGTWEASFQDKTFLTITLVDKGGKLSGTVVHDNFNLDEQGNITEIESRDAHEKITMVRPAGKGLDIYTHDDTDPSESGHYHLDLTNSDQGQVKLVVTEPGAPAIKPWTVKRNKS